VPEKHLERDLETIGQILSRLLGRESMDADEDIYEAGLTSIMVLPLLGEIEDTFHLTIPDTEFLDARTTRALARLIQKLRLSSP
jgi:acyl carrier protein